MPNASHAVQSCLNNFATYLAGKVTGLTVYKEWPAANQKLSYPSVTLFTGQVKTMNRSPEQIAVTTPDINNKVTATFVVGEHDFKLQVDLWCANKVQRDTVLGQIENAINAAVNDNTGNNNAAGLSLQLTDYFNDWARLDIDGMLYVDDEAAAQRQERRVKLDLLVNCRAILQRTYYAMTSIQTQIGVGPTQNSVANNLTVSNVVQ